MTSPSSAAALRNAKEMVGADEKGPKISMKDISSEFKKAVLTARRQYAYLFTGETAEGTRVSNNGNGNNTHKIKTSWDIIFADLFVDCHFPGSEMQYWKRKGTLLSTICSAERKKYKSAVRKRKTRSGIDAEETKYEFDELAHLCFFKDRDISDLFAQTVGMPNPSSSVPRSVVTEQKEER